MDQPSFALYPRHAGAHVIVRVYAGPDAEHRAFCGGLTMREEEWNALLLVAMEHGWEVKQEVGV